jgi:hypothetical protein
MMRLLGIVSSKKKTHTGTKSLNGPPIKKWNDDASYLDHPLLPLGILNCLSAVRS